MSIIEQVKHVHLSKLGNECVSKVTCAARSSSSSERQQPILKRLDAIYRLGHGLISQEVLEELQALPRAVEWNLVPCASDRHQCQTLVHLAPPTNLSKIHTVRTS